MAIESTELKREFLLAEDSTTVGQIREKVVSGQKLWTYVVVRGKTRYSVFRLNELIDELKRSSQSFEPGLLAIALADVPGFLAAHAAGMLEESELSAQRIRKVVETAPGRRWVVLRDGQVSGVVAEEVRSAAVRLDLDWLSRSAARADPVPMAEWPSKLRELGMDARERPVIDVSVEPKKRGGGLLGLERVGSEAAVAETAPVLARAEQAPPPSPERSTSPEAAPTARAEQAPPPSPERPTLPEAAPTARAELPPSPSPERPTSPEAAPTAVAAAPAPPAVADEPEKRFINAEIEGRGGNEPLRVGETFTLAFDVDLEVRKTSVGATGVVFNQTIFTEDEAFVDLTVQLSSEDFDVFTDPQRLRVPRRGRSQGKARFDVSAKKAGTGILQAVFLKDGNFVQLMTVRLEVGGVEAPSIASESRGRAVDASLDMQPRDVTLVLTERDDTFQAILASAVSGIATLRITLPELEQMVSEAREQLLAVVGLKTDGEDVVYQDGIDIPEDVSQKALRAVAEAGFNLFRRIFFGPLADAQANLMGRTLRQLSRGGRLKIQILSERFFLPWGILYMADKLDLDHVDREQFLGFRHVIEHIPVQQSMRVLDRTIDGRPIFSVSLNLNEDIDKQLDVTVIQDQLAYWEKVPRGGMSLVVRKTADEVRNALGDASSPDQLVYFYCHAASKSLSQGGPNASSLALTGGGSLTLGNLHNFAGLDTILPGAPLVFINACESAELSPLFYDGFVPYFVGKGARGVIGTECSTPAIFAEKWAGRFFDEFLKGRPVGEIFLDLRREFYDKHNNLLGLLYALYCDADTRLESSAARATNP